MIYNSFYFLPLHVMIKKTEKAEACTCEKCKCTSCSQTRWVIIGIIACLLALRAWICAHKAQNAAQASYNLNVLSAGWEENLKKMNELYSSEAYIKYATEQTEWYVNSFMSAYGNVTDEDETVVEDQDEETNNSTSPEEVKSVVEDMLKTSPIRGDKDARFTIVEYTELLCPYCQRHSQAGTINSVIEQFPWEVNSISKHFIIHWESALQLSAAMECIAELNPSIYHEVFDKAFAAYPVEMEGLINIAKELGVDANNLQTCIDEWRYTQTVEDMMNQGNKLFGVNWTPGNVIIDRQTGNFKLVSGAQPADAFVEAINSMKNA